MIPMVMSLVVWDSKKKNGKTGGLRLWLPLFLIWILILPLILVILITWAFIALLAWTSPGMKRFGRIIKAGALIMWNINGLQVDIRNRDSKFVLHF